MIFALAGRRIDVQEAAQPVFPPTHVALVRKRLQELFEAKHATALVCSAACGADLIALDLAESLGIESRVVLPFEPKRFRATSVIDRPGDWGAVFDRVLASVEQRGWLINLDLEEDSQEAYLRANQAILHEALSLGTPSGDQAAAVLVWNGNARAEGDTTALFGDAARCLGLQVFEVSTLQSAGS